MSFSVLNAIERCFDISSIAFILIMKLEFSVWRTSDVVKSNKSETSWVFDVCDIDFKVSMIIDVILSFLVGRVAAKYFLETGVWLEMLLRHLHISQKIGLLISDLDHSNMLVS